MNRMEHASQIIDQIARSRLKYVEVPVTIRYTSETLAKGQKSSDAIWPGIEAAARKGDTMNWNLPHEGITAFQVIFVPTCGFLAVRACLRTWVGRTSRFSGFLGILLWSGAAIAIRRAGFDECYCDKCWNSIAAGFGVLSADSGWTRRLLLLLSANSPFGKPAN